MEFPNLGAQCTVTTCKLLDFLPLKCQICNKTFCSEHFQASEHLCITQSKTIDEPVPLSASQKIACTYKGCRIKELLAVHCNGCKSFYCVSHRFPVDHECQGLKERELQLKKQKIDKKQEIQNTIANIKASQKPVQNKSARIGIKTSPTVEKVLMKRRCKGDSKVPFEKRVYFKIALPQNYNQKDVLEMYFDNAIATGLAIDQICKQAKISYNPVQNQGQKLLSLFNGKTGELLINSTDKKIKFKDLDVWEDGVPALILEYAEEGENSIPIELYKEFFKVGKK